MPSKEKIILWNTNVPFGSLQIPEEDLFCYARSHVFNKFGLLISSKDSAFGKNDRTRNYYCTCASCKKVTPPSSRWKISFKQTTQRSKSSTGSDNNDATYNLIDHNDNLKDNSHYNGASIIDETLVTWSTNNYQLLANFPEFQDLIKGYYSTDKWPTDKELYNEFRRKNANFSIQAKTDNTENMIKTLNRAKNSVINRLKKKTLSDEDEFYAQLPAYLYLLQEKNPNVTVAIQNDTDGRFMRCFVATPISSDPYFGTLTYPVFVSDCAHYKTKFYDGVIFNLSTKTVFGQIVTLVYAVIPRESVRHLSWVIRMCWYHGISVEKYPFFTDQGPLIDVFSSMMHTWGISFQVLLCLEHFQRNIRWNFKNFFPSERGHNSTCNDQTQAQPQFGYNSEANSPDILGPYSLRTILEKASESTSKSEYFAALDLLFFKCMAKSSSSDSQKISSSSSVSQKISSSEIALYILKRHPKTWTVFGNMSGFVEGEEQGFYEDAIKLRNTFSFIGGLYRHYKDQHKDKHKDYKEVVMELLRNLCWKTNDFQWSYTSFSDKSCRLMGFKRTNISESVANKSKASGARSSNVLLSIDLLTQDYNKSLKELIARLHNCPKPSRESAVQRTDIAKKVIMDISQKGISEIISVNHVPPFLLSDKSPKDGDTIQVIASLKDPTSNDPYNHHKSQLSWIYGANPPQFQYTCDHANHISTIAMHNMPCSCLKAVFKAALLNEYWPLSKDEPLIGPFLTYLQPGCYFVKTCVSVAQSAIKDGKNTLHINIPSQKEIKDRCCMFIDKPCKPPPKYKAGVKTKGKRIRSRGEDGYPHRQPLSGPRNGKQIKGKLNIPMCKDKSAAVEEIHDRDGNDIILSNSAQAEIIALQKITKRTQPIDELIKGIPVEMEKSIVPGKSSIRRKQIDEGKPHYSPFRENENSPEQYNPEDIRQQDLEPLSSGNLRPNDLIHRPNCSIRDNRNPLIHMNTLQKFFRYFGEADFPKITETFNKVLKSLIEERNEEFQEQYSGNEQSQEEETNTEENEQFEMNIQRNKSVPSSQGTNLSLDFMSTQDIDIPLTQEINILSTQDTEDTNMSDTGLGLTQECTTQESHDESMTNGIDNCTNNNREVQKTIKDEKLLPLLKRFKTTGKTASECENSPTPTAGETAGDYGNSPTPSNYSRAWLLHYGVRFNSGYNKEQLWKAAARTASNRDTVLKIYNDRNNSIVNGDRKDKMFERDRMDNMLVGNLKDKKWVTEFLKTHKKTFDRLGEHGQEEKKYTKRDLIGWVNTVKRKKATCVHRLVIVFLIR